MEDQVPGFGKMFSRDAVIKDSLSMIFGPLIFFLGVYIVDPTTMFFLPYLTLPIIIIGIFVFIYRYYTIISTFRDGITVKGTVIAIERLVTQRPKGGTKRSYFVKVNYSISGEEHHRRIRLPGDPEFYGIHDNQQVELVVKEENPKNVFIKHMYLD